MLLTFAYAMVNYYDSSIPGLGFSIKGFIDGGTINLVNLIGSDGSTTMLNEIHAASSKTGPSLADQHDVALLLDCVLCRAVPFGPAGGNRFRHSRLRRNPRNYHRIARAIFIPFLVFDKLDWLFWGWLKAYLGFSFYKVIAAATMNVYLTF